MELSCKDSTFSVFQVQSSVVSIDDAVMVAFRDALRGLHGVAPLSKADLTHDPVLDQLEVALVFKDGRSWTQAALEKSLNPPEQFVVVGAWRASEYFLLATLRRAIVELFVHYALEHAKVRCS